MERKEILTELPAVERYLFWLARRCTGEDAETLNRWAQAVSCARASIIADMLMGGQADGPSDAIRA